MNLLSLWERLKCKNGFLNWIVEIFLILLGSAVWLGYGFFRVVELSFYLGLREFFGLGMIRVSDVSGIKN